MSCTVGPTCIWHTGKPFQGKLRKKGSGSPYSPVPSTTTTTTILAAFSSPPSQLDNSPSLVRDHVNQDLEDITPGIIVFSPESDIGSPNSLMSVIAACDLLEDSVNSDEIDDKEEEEVIVKYAE